MDGKIFISYRRADNAMAWGLLRDRLVGEFGASQVFFDQHSIDSGEDWKQVIDRELKQAKLVVMVCGQAWAGVQADGSRRIDDPDDMVRYELARAHELGLRVEPFLIDPGALPAKDALPADLQYLADTNFRAYSLADSPLNQLDNWIDHLKNVIFGRQRVAHYLLQGLWTAWIAASVVWLLAAGGLTDGLRDGFDRLVQAIAATQTSTLETAGSSTQVVAIESDEFRELLGGRTPLDPEIMTILVDTLRQASRRQQQCRPQAPIGLALELAPGETGASDENYQKLAVALRQLAACRPVVLSCPQSLSTAQPPEADLLWLETISADSDPQRSGDGAQAPVLLASADLDPAVLRVGAARTELGVVVGDLTQDRPAQTIEDPCGCPWREQDRTYCAQQNRRAWVPDNNALLQPRAYPSYSLTKALQRADTLAQASALLIGGNFAHQDRISLPLATATAQAPMVTLHASVVDSVRDPPRQVPAALRYLFDVLTASLLACTVMLLWRNVALHPHLYTRRALAYGTFAVGVLGLPVLLAWLAAEAASLVPLAAMASMCVWAVALRAGLSGYEVLIDRGDGWRPFNLLALWRGAVRHGGERWSARLRLLVFVVEAAIGWAAVSQVLVSSMA
jgi:hypothetical protein